MAETKIIVGGSLQEDAGAFLDAWRRTERDESVDEHVLAFESWETLAAIMTGERYRLLRHIHAHPEPSVSALARALGRQYRRVHADVAALEAAGLVNRSEGKVRATVEKITAKSGSKPTLHPVSARWRGVAAGALGDLVAVAAQAAMRVSGRGGAHLGGTPSSPIFIDKS